MAMFQSFKVKFPWRTRGPEDFVQVCTDVKILTITAFSDSSGL